MRPAPGSGPRGDSLLRVATVLILAAMALRHTPGGAASSDPSRAHRANASDGDDRRRRDGEMSSGRTASPPPSDADSPADIPPKGWWEVAKAVYGKVEDDRLLAVAAGVTFYALLAIFPGIGATVSIFGLVANPETLANQLSGLNGVLPGGAIDIVQEQVKRISAQPGALSVGFAFGLAVSLWSANAGMKAIFDALNVAYEERERRSFIRLNLQSLFFTSCAILFMLLAIGALVVLPVTFALVGAESIGSWVVSLGRWPALFAIVLLALAILYRFGPDRRKPRWRWVTPGSIVASICWLIFSVAFSRYVSSFGSYNQTYGSLGAAIGFMTWIWLSTAIILIGAEINAETERQAEADGGRVEGQVAVRPGTPFPRHG